MIMHLTYAVLLLIGIGLLATDHTVIAAFIMGCAAGNHLLLAFREWSAQ